MLKCPSPTKKRFNSLAFKIIDKIFRKFYEKRIRFVFLSLPVLIYKAACVSVSESVSPPGHLVPGTNSEIEGLTIGKSGTNICKEWD